MRRSNHVAGVNTQGPTHARTQAHNERFAVVYYCDATWQSPTPKVRGHTCGLIRTGSHLA